MLIEASTPLYQDRLEEDLSRELQALAADIGAAAAYGAQEETTPDLHGVVSFIDTPPDEEDILFTALGNRLDSVSSEIERKETFAALPFALGALASETTISTTSGCWSLVEEWRDIKNKAPWRNEKGYTYIWNPEHFGYEVDRHHGFKGIAAHRMAYNMKLRASGLPDLKSKEQVDHVCRWTGCCNIDHLTVLSHRRNNELRDRAKKFEAALVSGQLILGPVGLGWLDERLLSSTEESTNILITTPMGPHRIVMEERDPLIFRAQAEPCELMDAVPKPSKKKYERASRAKKYKPMEGEVPLIVVNEDEIVLKPKTKDLYKMAMKAA